MVVLGVLTMDHYRTDFSNPVVVSERVQSWKKCRSRLQRCVCLQVLEEATDMRFSALDRGQLDNSKPLENVKNRFALHRDTWAQKRSKNSIFV